eukprot:1281546-Pleurochrysis_carterae.AAC.1
MHIPHLFRAVPGRMAALCVRVQSVETHVFARAYARVLVRMYASVRAFEWVRDASGRMGECSGVFFRRCVVAPVCISVARFCKNSSIHTSARHRAVEVR